jgi:hypothetical protein
VKFKRQGHSNTTPIIEQPWTVGFCSGFPCKSAFITFEQKQNSGNSHREE